MESERTLSKNESPPSYEELTESGFGYVVGDKVISKANRGIVGVVERIYRNDKIVYAIVKGENFPFDRLMQIFADSLEKIA